MAAPASLARPRTPFFRPPQMEEVATLRPDGVTEHCFRFDHAGVRYYLNSSPETSISALGPSARTIRHCDRVRPGQLAMITKLPLELAAFTCEVLLRGAWRPATA